MRLVCAAGAFSGWNTSCTIPERSRRSMKIRPPWSRRRWTQPATRAWVSARSAVELAAPGVAVAVRARRVLHSSRPPRRIAGITSADGGVVLLAGLHVLERGDAVVADDRHVPGADAVGVLELPLQRAAGQLELRLQPGAARLDGQLERRPRAVALGERDEQVDELAARAGARRAASSIRSTPAAQPDAGVGGPSSSSIRPS